MADIETLTEAERDYLNPSPDALEDVGFGTAATMKALRIIGAQAKLVVALEAQFKAALQREDEANKMYTAQAARIAELERNQVTPAMQAEFEMGKERLAKARQRIGTLEAQVLSSDTVAKAEYLQMVQQRDEMREERKKAREDAAGLRGCIEDALKELSSLRKNPTESWRLDEAIFQLGGCEED